MHGSCAERKGAMAEAALGQSGLLSLHHGRSTRDCHRKTKLERFMRYSSTIGIVVLSALAWPAAAHHGWSEYDSSKVLELTGTIKQSGYEHPHGHVSLETPGKVWEVVLAPPSRMQNRGLEESALKPGNKATVVGYPNRNKPEEMRAERITIGDKTVELR
jgi:hypothetical protein